jgi:hypothetical protein
VFSCLRTLAHAHFGNALKCFPLWSYLIFSSPRLLTSLRSCNGHAPLIIQEGPARAGQKVQPRRVRLSSALNSSKALRKGGGSRGRGRRVSSRSRSRGRTRKHLQMLHLFRLGIPPIFLPLPNLLEVVQRARPSYNPRVFGRVP